MNEERSIILHVGAPKCGSSALQTALSAAPVLTGGQSGTLAYNGLHHRHGRWSLLKGRFLRAAAERSVHGYISWPNPDAEDFLPLFSMLDRLRQSSWRRVPVVSNEGWIGQSDTFAKALPHWFTGEGGAPVEICAFARPPLDWLNAAYWQWGVWSGHHFGTWLYRMGMPYTLGAALSSWAALPNTRVRLELGGDVLSGFESLYGVTLPRPAQCNAALPPAMLGFLMRNRRYRPDAHSNATEFIFQRWCRVEGAPRPWAILPRHTRLVRAAISADLDKLFRLLPEEKAAAVKAADARWTSDEPYHARLIRGRSSLDDPEELAQLYRALVRGVGAAAEAAGQAMPRLPPVLATQASLHAWDVALAQALEHLIELDVGLRRKKWIFGL